MTVFRSLPLLRLTAFALDWLVLALWGGIAFGIVMFSTHGNPPGFSNPWQGQAVSFLVMTLPFTLYFAFLESSPKRATIGKRIIGLEVARPTGEQLSFATSFLRNGIKFVPWELGHLVAHQAAFAKEPSISTWVWGPALGAVIGMLWWMTTLFIGSETPYNRWIGARVIKRL